ncbi:MAG: hypothetical protein RLZZ353_123 [Actinomycetota bacterium]|jgi:hypothetical protein
MMAGRDPGPDRRGLLRAGLAVPLGITTLQLPPASAAASSFSESETGLAAPVAAVTTTLSAVTLILRDPAELDAVTYRIDGGAATLVAQGATAVTIASLLGASHVISVSWSTASGTGASTVSLTRTTTTFDDPSMTAEVAISAARAMVREVGFTAVGGAGGRGGSSSSAGGGRGNNPTQVSGRLAVTEGDVLVVAVGGCGLAGTSATSRGAGGAGGTNPLQVATWGSFRGGNGGNAGTYGSSQTPGAGGGGGAASVLIRSRGASSFIVACAGGSGGGGGAFGSKTGGNTRAHGTWGANVNSYGTGGDSAPTDGGGGGGGGGGTSGGTGGPVRQTFDANGNADRRGEGGEQGSSSATTVDVTGTATLIVTRTEGLDGEIALEMVTATIA